MVVVGDAMVGGCGSWLIFFGVCWFSFEFFFFCPVGIFEIYKTKLSVSFQALAV